jgi:membrane protein
MNFAGLSTLVNRVGALVTGVIAWADRVQRRHGLFGFPYAVIKKYGDDDGGREAALITYYGFLSIFPLLLLGVAILSKVLASDPELRQRLITEIVPPKLQPTIEQSVARLPTSTVPFIAGLIGLLFSGTGVVFSAYQTLNNVAAVPRRLRAGFFPRYIRVFVMLATLLVGAVAVGALTVASTALPKLAGVERTVAVLGSVVVIFGVLLLGARLLLVRHAPFRALWPGAVLGSLVVTLVLNLGPPLLARFVAKAGPVYGSFATVAGIFALLYLVSQALVYSAEVAAVRYARLWPRALDVNKPTAADFRAYTLLARAQERIQVTRVDLRVVPPDPPAAASDSPAAAGDSSPASRDSPPASRDSPPASRDTPRPPRDSPTADGGPPRPRPP